MNLVELGGIEPPSVEELPLTLRPFPSVGVAAADRRVE